MTPSKTITLTYRIKGKRQRRTYDRQHAERAINRAALLVTNGIPVTIKGLPRTINPKH